MSTIIDTHENEYTEEQANAVIDFINKDSKEYKIGKRIVMMIGGVAATSVCYSALTAVCPPAAKPVAKITRLLGINIISSYVGDKIFDYVGNCGDELFDEVNHFAARIKAVTSESDEEQEEVTE